MTRPPLLILLQRVPDEQLLARVGQRTELLAMTPSAMLQCDELGLPRLTPDDFVDFGQGRERAYALGAVLAAMFDRLDTCLDEDLRAARPYQADVYMCWVHFAHFLYVHSLCQALLGRFGRFLVLGAPAFRPLDEAVASLRFPGAIFDCFGSLLATLAMLLGAMLRPQFLDPAGEPPAAPDPAAPAAPFPLPPRPGPEKTMPVLAHVVWYGLEQLEKHLPELAYVSFGDVLRPLYANEERPEPPALAREASAFLEEWLPLLKDPLLHFFQSHFRDMVCAAVAVQRHVREVLDHLRPAMVCYPCWIIGLDHFALAREANRRGIPVLSVQHGGMALHRLPGEFPGETPFGIDLTWAYQGGLDSDSNPHVRRRRTGSITGRALAAKARDLPERAIYLHGGQSFIGYQQLPCSDHAHYESNRNVLGAFAEQGVPLDVKPHLLAADYSRDHFSRLIAGHPGADMVLLPHCAAEELLHRYGLVVMENIGSLAAVLALGLDVPVILHDPQDCKLRPHLREAVLHRVYFSRNAAELTGFVRRFAAGELPAKGVKQAREDFMWPAGGPDPVERLASLFCEVAGGLPLVPA